MSAAGGLPAGGLPAPGTPHAELERRYRRLLRLYPREFRVRRTDEMIGVLMASAAAGQRRPARGDVRDIVRCSLRERAGGPRGGWSFALAAFALAAPLFLVLTDILQVAFPYAESQAAVQRGLGILRAHGVPRHHGVPVVPGVPVVHGVPVMHGGPAAVTGPSALMPQHVGGLQFLGQHAFLVLVAGHLVVAAAVLAGWRRTALAALVAASAADYTQWAAFHVFQPGAGTVMFLTLGVFLLEAIALAVADPRAAHRREGWRHLVPALALATAAQLLAISFDASRVGDIIVWHGPELHATSGNGLLAVAGALALLAVLLPLPLALGWRASLLLAAACYPLVILAAAASGPAFGELPETLGLGRMPFQEAHLVILTILYLPPLLVLARAVTQTLRPRRPSRRDLAA